MKVVPSAIDGIHSAEALLGSTAARLVGKSLGPPQFDVVTLSDVAIALIQARLEVQSNLTAYQAAVKMEQALIDVMA